MRKLMIIFCCLSMVPSALAAASYDGSVPLLCAVLTIMDCGNDSSTCQQATAEAVNIPRFFKVDVSQKTIASTGSEARQAVIRHLDQVNGRLMMQGGQGGRGWSIVIAEDTGKLTATMVDDGVGFVIFGACTPLP